MRIEYKLSNEDFIEHQFFSSSKLKNTKKRLKYVKIYVPIAYILYGIYLSQRDEDFSGFMFFFTISIVWYFLYPKYLKRRYKKHYSTHVKENYSNRINKITVVELLEEYIKTTDVLGEGKIKTSEIKELIELKEHFLIKLTTEQALIIPKSADFDQTELKMKVLDYGAKYVDETKWKWG